MSELRTDLEKYLNTIDTNEHCTYCDHEEKTEEIINDFHHFNPELFKGEEDEIEALEVVEEYLEYNARGTCESCAQDNYEQTQEDEYRDDR